ncbi:MAG: DUF2505 family protein [bacterium]
MGERYRLTASFGIGAAELAKLMATPGFAEAEAFIDGAVEARCVEQGRDGAAVRFRIDRVDHSRERSGKKAKGKTERSVTHQDWDLAKASCRWRVEAPGYTGIVDVRGTTRLEPEPGGCRYTEEGEMTVRIPVIGRIIARSVVADIKRGFPQKVRFIEETIAKSKN